MKISISDNDLSLILSSLETSKILADIAVNAAISNDDFVEFSNACHVKYRVIFLIDKLNNFLNREGN